MVSRGELRCHLIQPSCKLRHDINNKLSVIVAKCDHLEAVAPSPSVLEATSHIKEIALGISEKMHSGECRAELIATIAGGR